VVVVRVVVLVPLPHPADRKAVILVKILSLTVSASIRGVGIAPHNTSEMAGGYQLDILSLPQAIDIAVAAVIHQDSILR